MQFYSGSSGCLILLIIMIFIMMFAGFLMRVLFTTPLGILLLIFLLARYLLKKRDNNFEKTNDDSNMNFDKKEATRVRQDEFISRDAEDVEYAEINSKEDS